ncbi:MAG TPA: hypothetical protein VN892_11285 [Solirubrobacteraceae bacterium]|nr:hypothetical protein [Solirubrobacteraceae bacterium]
MGTLLAIAALAACGGAGDSANLVVARVGKTAITRSTLDHWMSTLVGGDYFESIGRRAPSGLVSDPPNYPACASAIEAIGPPRLVNATATIDRAGLEERCQQLYAGIKRQGVTYLIAEVVSVDEDAERGIVVTDAEIEQKLKEVKAEQFPTQSAFAAYLSNHRWTLADELDVLKRNVLEEKLEELVKRRLGSAADGPAAVEQALIAIYRQSIKRYTARTHCRSGYLAPDCAGYRAPRIEPTSPDVLLEQMADSRT